MSENQKNDSKKSFLQRNLFLIVVFLIIITVAGGYLYRNNLLIFDEAQFSKLNQETQSLNVQKEITPVNDLNNKELEEKNIDFKSIKTAGDLEMHKKISEIGGKNLFCKEIEESLLAKE